MTELVSTTPEQLTDDALAKKYAEELVQLMLTMAKAGVRFDIEKIQKSMENVDTMMENLAKAVDEEAAMKEMYTEAQMLQIIAAQCFAHLPKYTQDVICYKDIRNRLLDGRNCTIAQSEVYCDMGPRWAAKFGPEQATALQRGARVFNCLSQWDDRLAQSVLRLETFDKVYERVLALDPEDPQAKVAAIAALEAEGYQRQDRGIVSEATAAAWSMSRLLTVQVDQ